MSLDPFPGSGAQAGAAADRVDGDVSIRLQGREDDALPQRHDAPRGPRGRGKTGFNKDKRAEGILFSSWSSHAHDE